MIPQITYDADKFLALILRGCKGLLALAAVLLVLTWWAGLTGCTGLYAGKDVETALRQRSRFAWDENSNFGTDIDGTHTGAFTMGEGQITMTPDGEIDPEQSYLTNYLAYRPKADNAQNSYVQAAQSAERINDRWSQSFDNLASIISTVVLARGLQTPSGPGQFEQLGGDVRSAIEAEVRKRLNLPNPNGLPPPDTQQPSSDQSMSQFRQRLLDDVLNIINQRLGQQQPPNGPSIAEQLGRFRDSLMTDIGDLIDRKIGERDGAATEPEAPGPPKSNSPATTQEANPENDSENDQS